MGRRTLGGCSVIQLRLGAATQSHQQYLDSRGVKDCWFVYFGEGVIDTSYYGIPCKALPTLYPLSLDEEFYGAPEVVDGMVLISAGDLIGSSGWERLVYAQHIETQGSRSLKRFVRGIWRGLSAKENAASISRTEPVG